MERFWTIVAAAGVVTAAVLFFLNQTDAMFVAAVLGCVAWFLSFRVRIKKNINTESNQNS